MNDFVQLREETNVFQTETTIEGTLDDFDFGEGANDERPGKTTGQEASPGEGNNAEKAAKGTKRKVVKKTEGEPKAKGRSGGAAKKKPSKVRLWKRLLLCGKVCLHFMWRKLCVCGEMRQGRSFKFQIVPSRE